MEILKIKNAIRIINSEDELNSILVIGEEKFGELKDSRNIQCREQEKNGEI